MRAESEDVRIAAERALEDHAVIIASVGAGVGVSPSSASSYGSAVYGSGSSNAAALVIPPPPTAPRSPLNATAINDMWEKLRREVNATRGQTVQAARYLRGGAPSLLDSNREKVSNTTTTTTMTPPPFFVPAFLDIIDFLQQAAPRLHSLIEYAASASSGSSSSSSGSSSSAMDEKLFESLLITYEGAVTVLSIAEPLLLGKVAMEPSGPGCYRILAALSSEIVVPLTASAAAAAADKPSLDEISLSPSSSGSAVKAAVIVVNPFKSAASAELEGLFNTNVVLNSSSSAAGGPPLMASRSDIITPSAGIGAAPRNNNNTTTTSSTSSSNTLPPINIMANPANTTTAMDPFSSPDFDKLLNAENEI